MSSLSTADTDALYNIGVDTLHNLVALVVEAVLYTIYFGLVFAAGRILLKRSHNWKSTASFGVILTMLVLDTAICVIDVNNAVREITKTLMSSSPESIADRYNALALPWAVESAIYSFMSNLGDAIIIWRAHVFWGGSRERWMMLIPLACLFSSIITSVLLTYCVAVLDASLLFGSSPGDLLDPSFCKHSQLASYIAPLVTTAVVTLMIGYKTWLYRSEVGVFLRSSPSSRTQIEKVMTVLTESGFLYFLFFLSAVVGDTGDLPARESSTPQLAFASTVWTYCTSHILGIYPALIVILVHTQRSYIPGIISTASSSLHFSNGTRPSQSEVGVLSQQRRRTAAVRAGEESALNHVVDFDIHELRSVRHSRSTLHEDKQAELSLRDKPPISPPEETI